MLTAFADDILSELKSVNQHYKIHGYDLKFVEKIQTFIELQQMEKQLSEF